MNVDRSNFADVLPQFRELLRAADFAAIDCEFTGLHTHPSRADKCTDSLSEKYANAVDSASNFAIVQYGVCLYRRVGDNKFECTPFNFATFPRSVEGTAAKRFMCDASSVEFLLDNHFDFQQAFSTGIGHLTPRQEADQARRQSRPDKQWVVSEKDSERLEPVLKTIAEWLAKRRAPKGPLHVNVARWYDVNLLAEIAKTKDGFAGIAVLPDPANKSGALVYRPADAEAAVASAKAAKEAELATAAGFRLVLDALSASGKPIIGHNCFLDFMYTLAQYYDGMPSEMRQGIAKWLRQFPRVLDTKYIVSRDASLVRKFESNHLGGLYEEMGKMSEYAKIKFVMTPGFDKYSGSAELYHEAGFDAFCTGVVFARLAVERASSFEIAGLPVTSDVLWKKELNCYNLYGHNRGLCLHLKQDDLDVASFIRVPKVAFGTDREIFAAVDKAVNAAKAADEAAAAAAANKAPLVRRRPVDPTYSLDSFVRQTWLNKTTLVVHTHPRYTGRALSALQATPAGAAAELVTHRISWNNFAAQSQWLFEASFIMVAMIYFGMYAWNAPSAHLKMLFGLVAAVSGFGVTAPVFVFVGFVMAWVWLALVGPLVFGSAVALGPQHSVAGTVAIVWFVAMAMYRYFHNAATPAAPAAAGKPAGALARLLAVKENHMARSVLLLVGIAVSFVAASTIFTVEHPGVRAYLAPAWAHVVHVSGVVCDLATDAFWRAAHLAKLA